MVLGKCKEGLVYVGVQRRERRGKVFLLSLLAIAWKVEGSLPFEV